VGTIIRYAIPWELAGAATASARPYVLGILARDRNTNGCPLHVSRSGGIALYMEADGLTVTQLGGYGLLLSVVPNRKQYRAPKTCALGGEAVHAATGKTSGERHATGRRSCLRMARLGAPTRKVSGQLRPRCRAARTGIFGNDARLHDVTPWQRTGLQRGYCANSVFCCYWATSTY